MAGAHSSLILAKLNTPHIAALGFFVRTVDESNMQGMRLPSRRYRRKLQYVRANALDLFSFLI
ncbi:hypothetical protein CWC28_18795 [Pseudoalteromonas sp. S4492]|nr:hypothetical protein CWC28_18795 [Pseudoalteromonas sp. S4492]